MVKIIITAFNRRYYFKLFIFNVMKKMSFLIVIMLQFIGCGLELTKVDINLEAGFVPEVAVSSYLIPDSLIRLRLVMTRAAYSTNYTKATLKNATIECVSDNQSYVLSQNQKDNYIELFSKELKPIAGGIYKLLVETQNPTYVLESIDTIPIITTILDAEILPVEKSSNQLGKIKFKPNANSIGTTYYELVILICDKSSLQPSNIFYQIPITTNNQIITREAYYPSLLLIGSLEPQSLLFRLDIPNEIVNIDFMYRGNAMISSKGISSLDHELKIELRSVSYSYFRYKSSLYKQGYAASGDLLYGMASPVKVLGNIAGGLGIFSGYSKNDTIISVAGRKGLND